MQPHSSGVVMATVIVVRSDTELVVLFQDWAEVVAVDCVTAVTSAAA